MGTKKPRLREMVARAQGASLDMASFGPRRLVVQCHHDGDRRNPVAEVRGHHLVGTAWPWDQPHDSRFANYEARIGCTRCHRVRLIDWMLLRAALRDRKSKINVDEVAKRDATLSA